MVYEVRVKGHLSPIWSEWFSGLTIDNRPGGEAVLTGRLPDDAALYGVLSQLQALNLPLISVRSLSEGDAHNSPLDE